MATYWKREDGRICVADQTGDGEFSLCGQAYDSGSDLPGGDVTSFKDKGPANCIRCHDAERQIRASIARVRFSSYLIDGD